jgi:membrane-bound metal-dependent hydrolase YbcI (DUF457 family)
LDNVTHTLFGLTLARTRLGSGRGATLALVIASNVPDIDIVSTSAGAVKYLEWHRGLTHGPLGAIALAALTAAAVTGGTRVLDRRSAVPKPAARFGALAFAALAAIVCHVLMDLPTSYGVRLLSPFSWRWFTTDWMPIVDMYLLVALAASLLYGRGSQAARRRNLGIVSVLIVALYSLRAVGHHEALGLAARAFGPMLPPPCERAPAGDAVIARWPTAMSNETPADGTRCLIDIAALPTFISPVDWRLVAQMSNGYAVQDVNLFERRLRDDVTGSRAPWRLSVRYPNQWNADVFRAASTRVGRVFLGFSRFPAARSVRTRDGTSIVQWTDLRFLDMLGRGGGRARSGLFTATVRFDSGGSVVDQHLGPDSAP